jgi:hypothetical protein
MGHMSSLVSCCSLFHIITEQKRSTYSSSRSLLVISPLLHSSLIEFSGASVTSRTDSHSLLQLLGEVPVCMPSQQVSCTSDTAPCSPSLLVLPHATSLSSLLYTPLISLIHYSPLTLSPHARLSLQHYFLLPCFFAVTYASLPTFLFEHAIPLCLVV